MSIFSRRKKEKERDFFLSPNYNHVCLLILSRKGPPESTQVHSYINLRVISVEIFF